MSVGERIRRLVGLVLVASLGATLWSVGSARASDARAGAASDRLFYGTPITQDITAFKTESGEPATATSVGCTTYNGPTVVTLGKTAWYRLVGTGGTVDLSTAGSTSGADPLDTALLVYELGGLSPVACDDDAASGDRTSRVSIETTANTVYEVQVGTFANSCAGACTLHLAATNPLSPSNDNRAQAIPLTSATIANNNFASEEPGEATACPNQGANQNQTRNFAMTIWYAFTAPATGTATFRSGGTVDTVAALYEGNSPSFIACNDDDGTATLSSRITAAVNGGTTYFLQLGGWNGNHGAFSLSVDFVPNHDLDGDGYLGAQFGGPDCNDSSAAVHPGADDAPGNGVDENCDGHDSTPTPGSPSANPSPPPASKPKSVCVVPKLIGKPVKVDRKRLNKAHCRLGKVTGPKGRSAEVQKQSVKPGKHLPAGTKVNVVVG